MIWIVLGVLALIVIFVIVSYNGLVKNRMQTKEAWSQIDVQLKRRNDLLPNLIETVKGYAKYEGSTLEKVTQLRNQVAAATSPAEAMKASDALTRQVSGIFAVAENYPDLKASTNFIKLQEELTIISNYKPSQVILLQDYLVLKQQTSFKLQKRKRRSLKSILAV